MRFRYRQAAAFPLTQVVLVYPRSGACLDPAESRGLSRLTAQMLFAGADGLGRKLFDAKLEQLGANVGCAVANDHFTVRLVTLTENLDAGLALFEAALHHPNLDGAEFSRLQQELHSQWISDREEHKRLRAQDVYLDQMYRGQPTGYRSDGTATGLRNATIEAVQAHYPRMFGDGEPILGVVTDLPEVEARQRIAERLANRPATVSETATGTANNTGNGMVPGTAYPWDDFSPDAPSGREITIVPDPETQTDELVAGVFSAGEAEPDWHIHRLIALIFGGDMNSRLFRILRGERGYSYGASCWYEASRGNSPRNSLAPFTLYTFPTSEFTDQALLLLIELYEELVTKGVTEEELERARQALTHSHAFLRDTPNKMLALDCEDALHGLTTDDEATNHEKLAAVTVADVQGVLERTHHPERISLVMLGDPARLEPLAAGVSGTSEVRTVIYPPPR